MRVVRRGKACPRFPGQSGKEWINHRQLAFNYLAVMHVFRVENVTFSFEGGGNNQAVIPREPVLPGDFKCNVNGVGIDDFDWANAFEHRKQPGGFRHRKAFSWKYLLFPKVPASKWSGHQQGAPQRSGFYSSLAPARK